MTDSNWYTKDAAAWNKAAAELDQEGYTRLEDPLYLAVFVRSTDIPLVLVRSLGYLNWHPRPLVDGG